MLKKIKLNKKGFTLAELLIVIAVIAVLVAIAIPAFSGALGSAQEASANANVRSAFAEYQYQLLKNPATIETAYGTDGITTSTEAMTFYKSLTYQQDLEKDGYTIDVSKNPWTAVKNP